MRAEDVCSRRELYPLLRSYCLNDGCESRPMLSDRYSALLVVVNSARYSILKLGSRTANGCNSDTALLVSAIGFPTCAMRISYLRLMPGKLPAISRCVLVYDISTTYKFSVQFRCTRFFTSFGVSPVFCGTHLRLLEPTTWLHSQWMLHWWRVSGSTARELFPCIHPLTPSTRLDKLQVPFVKSSVWPYRELNPA